MRHTFILTLPLHEFILKDLATENRAYLSSCLASHLKSELSHIIKQLISTLQSK
jgi:hypothetical protein